MLIAPGTLVAPGTLGFVGAIRLVWRGVGAVGVPGQPPNETAGLCGVDGPLAVDRGVCVPPGNEMLGDVDATRAIGPVAAVGPVVTAEPPPATKTPEAPDPGSVDPGSAEPGSAGFGVAEGCNASICASMSLLRATARDTTTSPPLRPSNFNDSLTCFRASAMLPAVKCKYAMLKCATAGLLFLTNTS